MAHRHNMQYDSAAKSLSKIVIGIALSHISIYSEQCNYYSSLVVGVSVLLFIISLF